MNKEFKRMIKLAGLTEIKINIPGNLSSPEAFQRFIDSIPNEKYFYIFDEDDYSDVSGGDLVDLFYDPIFDNELKGKPGIEGNSYNEFQDIDQEDKEEGEYYGRKTLILVDKIIDIITSYNPEYSEDFQ